ncbi:MAG: hypothetical protein ACRCZ5_02745 [Burkholderiales bacterium]
MKKPLLTGQRRCINSGPPSAAKNMRLLSLGLQSDAVLNAGDCVGLKSAYDPVFSAVPPLLRRPQAFFLQRQNVIALVLCRVNDNIK